MECPATKRRKLEGGVFRDVEFDKCVTLGREDFPDLDSDTLKNVSEQHVVLTDASWDHFTGYNIGMGPIMVHHPLHHECVHPTGSFHVCTHDRIQMDVDLPQVTIALESIKILETGDKNSKGKVVKYHPISKIEADHLMILPIGTNVRIEDLKNRTELNGKFGYITHHDLSKQRYLVHMTDGCIIEDISVKFDNVVAYEKSKADDPLEEIDQPVYRVANITSTKVSDIFEDNGPVYRSKKACSLEHVAQFGAAELKS